MSTTYNEPEKGYARSEDEAPGVNEVSMERIDSPPSGAEVQGASLPSDPERFGEKNSPNSTAEDDDLTGERAGDDRTPSLPAADIQEAWSNFLKSVQEYDKQKVDNWKAEMDNLLVFTGLFSAVVTTFVTGSLQSLQQNPAQTSAAILAQISMQLSSPGAAPSQPPASFQADPNDVHINMLWVLSLTLSLIVAFLAIAVQQWLRAFPLPRSVPVQDAVLLRHSRFRALARWQVPDIITLLPVLLQVAVVLFLVGLYLVLQSINRPISTTYAVVAGLPFFLYAVTLFLPLVDPNCPFKSPLVPSLLWLSAVFGTVMMVAFVIACVALSIALTPVVVAEAIALIAVLFALASGAIGIAVVGGILGLPWVIIAIVKYMRRRRTTIPPPATPTPDRPEDPGHPDAASIATRASGSLLSTNTIPEVKKRLQTIEYVGRRRIPIPKTKEDFWTDRELRRLPRDDSDETVRRYVKALAWAPYAVQFHLLKNVRPCLYTLSRRDHHACLVAWAALYLGHQHIASVEVEREKLIKQPIRRDIRHLSPVEPTLLGRVNRAFAEEFKPYLLEVTEAVAASPDHLAESPSTYAILVLSAQLVVSNAIPDMHNTLVPVFLQLWEAQSFAALLRRVTYTPEPLHYPAICLFRSSVLMPREQRYMFSKQDTIRMVGICNTQLSDISKLKAGSPPRDRLTSRCILQEHVLASAATILTALTQQPAEFWEDEEAIVVDVRSFLQSLESFLTAEQRNIQDVGVLCHKDDTPQNSLISTPLAMKVIASSLLKLWSAERVALLGTELTLSLVQAALGVCEDKSAFEPALPLLLQLRNALVPPSLPEPPAEEPATTTEERAHVQQVPGGWWARVRRLLGLGERSETVVSSSEEVQEV